MNRFHRLFIKFGVLERCQQVLEQCPQDLIDTYRICVADAKQLIRDIFDMGNNEHSKFLLHLLVAATRGFEGYDTYTNMKNQTIPFFKSDPLPENHIYQENPMWIGDFDNQVILLQARKQFSKDKVVLTNLCQFKVTQYQIDKFFEQSEVKYFISQAELLDGLSSFDGMTTYVNINRTAENQRDTLLHEWSHNFPRFLWKNTIYITQKKSKSTSLCPRYEENS